MLKVLEVKMQVIEDPEAATFSLRVAMPEDAAGKHVLDKLRYAIMDERIPRKWSYPATAEGVDLVIEFADPEEVQRLVDSIHSKHKV